MGSGAIRLGGVFGIASAAALDPAFLVGSPEVPKNPHDAHSHFDSAASFLTANGTLPLLHTRIGLPGAYSMIVWIGLTGLLMLAIPPVVQVESIGA